MLLTHYGDCCDYFRGKCMDWEQKDPSHDIRNYIDSKGKQGLCDEFKTDSLFQDVICPYLKNYAQGKEKDVTKSIIKDALSILQGNLLQTQINIIIGAVLLSCGFSEESNTLLKIAVGGLILAGLISAFASLKK
jgi:hypothetical protein